MFEPFYLRVPRNSNQSAASELSNSSFAKRRKRLGAIPFFFRMKPL